MENIQKGSIVKFNGRFYRISDARGKGDRRWCNLAGIYGSRVKYKEVPVTAVVEAESEWWDRFTQSDTYRQM